MSHQIKRKHLLLSAVISLSLSTFGCSPSGSNSQNASPAASAPASNVENTNQTAPSSPASSPAASDGKENANNQTPAPAKGSAGDYYQQGIAKAKEGDLDSAEKLWRKSLELDSKNAEVHSNMGVLQQRVATTLQSQGKQSESLSKLEEAVNHHKDSVRLAPDNPENQVKLALALGQQRKLDDSIAQLNELTRRKPDYVPAYVVLAQVLSEQGKPDEAIANLTKARDILKTQGKTDQLVQTQVQLAVLLGQQSKLDESIAQSREAIRLKPDFAQAHYILALGLSQQGKKEEAIASLTKTRDLLQSQGQKEQAGKVDEIIQQLNQKK